MHGRQPTHPPPLIAATLLCSHDRQPLVTHKTQTPGNLLRTHRQLTEETPSTIRPPAPKELAERRGTKRRRGGRVKKCFFKGKLLVQRLKEGAAGPKAGAPRQRKLLIMLGITHSTAWGPRQGSRPGGTQSNRQWPSQVGAATIWLLLNATQKYLVVTRRSAFPSEVKQFGLLLVLFLSRENLPMVQRWQRIQKMFSVLCDPNETL